MEKEVVITYETLFELLRREKSREDLQQLPENFSEETKKYLSEKKQTALSDSNDPFAEIEQEKSHRQIANIKKILNELYERREKKVIAMALNKSRMPKSVIDIGSLSGAEKPFYEKLISIFNDARQDAIRRLVSELGSEPANALKAEPEKPLQEIPVEESEEEEAKEEKAEPAVKIADGTQKVKFICDVSQFVGPNLEIYGPFRAEELAVLPVSVCNVLISKNKAEPGENEGQTF